MGLFDKKTQVYVRPTGWRANSIWQALVATYYYPLRWMAVLAFGLCMFSFLMSIVLSWHFSKPGDSFWELLQSSFVEMGSIYFSWSPVSVMLPAVFLYQAPFLQLVFAKQLAIPRVARPILQSAIFSIGVAGLIWFLAVLPSSWVGAFWTLGLWMLGGGIAFLLLSYPNRVLFTPIPILYLLGMAYYMGYGLKLGLFDTPRFELIAGAVILSIAAFVVWTVACSRFLRHWVPDGQALKLFAKQYTYNSPTAQKAFVQTGHQSQFDPFGWLLIGRVFRFEQCVAAVPKTFWGRVYFFHKIGQPIGGGWQVTIFWTMFLVLAIFGFSLSPAITGIAVSVVFSATLTQVLAVGTEWIRFFEFETLLPISKQAYFRITVISRLGNIFRAFLPWFLAMPFFFLFHGEAPFTATRFLAVGLFIGFACLFAQGLVVLAFSIPLAAVFGLFMVGQFAGLFLLPWQTEYSLPILCGLFSGSVALLLFGLWRLARVEPGRVGKW